MRDIAKYFGSGRIGTSLTMKFTPTGTPVAEARFVTSRQKGEKEVATWFDMTWFGRDAENAHKYLTKGQKITVAGNFRAEEFNGKTRLKIIVDSWQFADRKPDSTSDNR